MIPIPRDHETERTVIAAVILRPSMLPEVMAELQAEDFDHAGYRVVWNAMLQLDRDGVPIDFASLLRAVGDSVGLVGGYEGLGRLADNYASSANAVSHARALREVGQARRVYFAACECLDRDALEDPAAWARDTASAVMLAAESGVRTRRTIVDQVESAMRMVDAERKGTVACVPTMSRGVDRLLGGGMKSGGMYVVAGRPGMGKSAWALACVRHATLRLGIPALYTSHEMTAESQVLRTLSAEARVDSYQVRGRGLSDDGARRMVDHAAKLARAPIEIVDDTSDLAEVEARARVWRQRTRTIDATNRGLIVCDYAQLLEAEAESRQLAVSLVSRTCKRMAMRLGVPVMLLSQVNRACEMRQDKRPLLSDLRESGSLEQDADAVMFLYRHGVYHREAPQHQAEAIVAKQRDGQVGMVPLHWMGEHTTFHDVETRR